ncbi:MAG: HEAT repeat domain-containing protein, partial [Planctomycetota bacterium]|nr:HEAT repeat domain-containing protein [Planctomycetota bacterium]
FKQRSQDLMRRFGYPGEIESLAVAKVLAEKGKYLLTDVKLLLSHRNPDIRCGALRTLGYMFWHGTVTTRRYRSIPPQELDQTGLEVVTLICALSNDRSFWVRYCVAESLGMIGAVNQEIVKTLVKLAGDPDPMVCAAALKTTKFRNQEDDSNVRILNATIKHCPLTTYANGNFAGLLFSRYFRRTDVDWELMSGYLKQHDAGMAGPGLWHPMRACEYRISSNRADVYRILPGLLHVYSMGWLRSRLESRLFRNLIAEKPEPFEQKALQLQKEIRNLEKQKPIGWEDRMLRYQTAIEGINRLLQKNRSRKN